MRGSISGILLAAVVASIAVATLVPTVLAQAPAARDASITRVTSPGDGSLVRGQEATLTLTVRRGGRIWRARLNGEGIAARLRGSGTRTVVLTRADGLKRGENRLKIHSRLGTEKVDYDEVAFTVAVEQKSLASIGRPSTGATAGAPVTAAVSTGPGIVSFRATLNGQSVSSRFSGPTTRGLRTATLGADHGLRYGRNRLLVVAVSSRGTYASVARTFQVADERPLAAAGASRRTKAGVPIRLDGRESVKAPSATGAIKYQWTLVRRPKGSKATLSRATGARPSLRPDRPGRYRARLVVSHKGPAPAPSVSGQGSTLASTPPTVTSTPATVDIIATQPNMQIPVNTMASQGGTPGIVIGQTFYPNPGGAAAPQAHLMVLDRATLEVVANAGSPNFDTPEPTILELLVKYVGDDSKLVVLSVPPGVTLVSDSTPDRLTAAFVALIIGDQQDAPGSGIGGNLSLGTPAGDEMLLGARPFSLIGVPGTPQGSADQSNRSATSSVAAGQVSGSFMQDAWGNYSFVSDEYAMFETRSASTANTNTITVNGESFEGSIPPNSGGFQVLVLSRTDLGLISNQSFATAGGDVDQASAMNQLLQTAASEDSLVFVASIGEPGGGPSEAAAGIQAVGGTADVFMRGGNDYTLAAVAGQGPTPGGGIEVAAQAQEAAGGIDIPGQTTGAQAGLLGRSNDFGFEPTLAASGTGENLELAVIAHQPPKAWPGDDDPALVAANSYIAGQLGLGGGDVRFSYPSNVSISWPNLASQLSELSNPICNTKTESLPERVSGLFSEAQYCYMVKQFQTEFSWVSETINLFTLMGSTLDQSTAGQGLDLQSIASTIEGDFTNPPPDDTAVEVVADIAEALAYTIGVAPDPEAALAGNLLAAAIQVGVDLTNQPDGTPAGLIDTTVGEIGSALSAQATASQRSLGQLQRNILSDYGRLRTVGEKIVSSQPGWAWSTDTPVEVAAALSVSGKQTVYSMLMPVAFPAWVIQAPNASQSVDSPDSFSCDYSPGDALDDLPESAQWAEVLDPVAGTKRLWVLGLPERGSGVELFLPSAAVTDPLFASPSNGGAGLYAPWFFTRAYGLPTQTYADYFQAVLDDEFSSGLPPNASSTLVQLPTEGERGPINFFGGCDIGG